MIRPVSLYPSSSTNGSGKYSAVVTAANPDTPHQPVVRVIFDDLGIPLMPPRDVDLSEVDPETGAARISIIKTTDPEKYGINVKEYFV